MRTSYDSDLTEHVFAAAEQATASAWSSSPLGDPRALSPTVGGSELPPDPCEDAGRAGSSARSWAAVAAALVAAALASGAALGLAIVEYGGAGHSASTAVTPGAASAGMNPPAPVAVSSAAIVPPAVVDPPSIPPPAIAAPVLASTPDTAGGSAAVSAPTTAALQPAVPSAPVPTDDAAPPDTGVVAPPPPDTGVVAPPPIPVVVPTFVINVPTKPQPPVTVTVTPPPPPPPPLPLPCKVMKLCMPHPIPHV